MADKFSGLVFTDEGKNVMTEVLANKGQMSIITVYTFAVALTKSLTYSQISGLNPKQNKPVGTVTPDLTTNTVETRIIIDNREVTADYNLKGLAITGTYGGKNFVLGIINTNETTLVPAYNGQSAQTINLDVSFAISDTSVVTINTQYAGMLTVADYIALQQYIDKRDATKADDTATVHKTGNETINDIKTFLKTIVGSVSGNSGTTDRVNTLAINSDVTLSSLSNGVYLSTNTSKTTSDKPNGAGEAYVFVKESNIERFTDISTGQSYFRVKNGSTYTAWNRFSTAAELSSVDTSAVHKAGAETISGVKTFSSSIIGNLQGNADTASKLKTARTISFSGAATGAGTFDGSGNVDIALTEAEVTRKDTSSAQSLTVGGTVTIIDSVTTNTSGEITGVNVKTATMPSVFPPSNDANLVHKTGDESVSGFKSFTGGLSGELTGNASSATKLKTARKINDVAYDGTSDIRVDPVVQTFTTNVDVFTLANGFYYYSNVAATNKPSGSTNYFVVEVIQTTNNGFMHLVDSNNNAWWTTKSGGTWGVWKAEANDALVAHLANSETFTGKKTFSAGISTTNLDVSGTTNLTTLNVTDPISGSLGVKTATFTDFAVVAKNMKQYSGRWLATSSNAILNGPTGTIDFNAYIEVAYTWSDAGIITVSNQGSNTWIGTVSSGVIRKWTLVANNSEVVQKTGDTMTGGLTGGQINLPASGDLNTLTDTGKYYQTTSANTANWVNRPSNAPSLAFSVDVIGQANQSLVTQVYYVHTTSRMWIRTMWLNGTTITTSQWTELANDANVVHNTGNETIAGDKTFTGNVNVSGTLSSTDTYLRVGKPILSPIISSSVVMWYGWKVYYYVHNGVVTYQIQTNSSTIPAGTKSNEKLPAAARPIYKTFVPLAYGGQGFAINIDGTFENYTGAEISGASWASATSHVLNL